MVVTNSTAAELVRVFTFDDDGTPKRVLADSVRDYLSLEAEEDEVVVKVRYLEDSPLWTYRFRSHGEPAGGKAKSAPREAPLPPPGPAAKLARDMPCDELVTTLMPWVGSDLDYPVAFLPRVEVRRCHENGHSPGRLQLSAWRKADRYADLLVETGQMHVNRVVAADPVVAVETYEEEAHKLFVFTFDRKGMPKLALREESVYELRIGLDLREVRMMFRPGATAPPKVVWFWRRDGCVVTE